MQSRDLSLQVASLLSRYVEEGKSKQQDNTGSMICSRVLSLNDFSIVWKLQTAHHKLNSDGCEDKDDDEFHEDVVWLCMHRAFLLTFAW